MTMTPVFLASTSGADAAATTLLQWLGLSLLYGTLLAGFTWLLMRTAFRRAGLACAAVIWSVVLLKFIVPAGPGFAFSLATLIESTRTAIAPTPPPETQTVPTCEDVQFVTIFDQGSPQPACTPAPVEAPPQFPWALGFAGLYITCVVVVLAVRLIQFAKICRRCSALPRASAELIGLVDDACRRVGLLRRPDVRLSDEAPAPFVVGVLRPTLVLSHRHLADSAETEAVVLHELGHLRPLDLILRCLQCSVGTLLFFWPVVAWVNRRIDLAREHACDDWALSHGKLSSSEYARCLLRALQPVRSNWSLYQPAAMAANPRHVERRIEMILEHTKTRNHARTLGVGALLVVAAWGVFALSGSAQVNAAVDPADNASPPACDTTKKIVVTRVHNGDEGNVDVEVVKLEDGKMKVTINGKDEIIDVPAGNGQTSVACKTMAFVAKSDDQNGDLAHGFAWQQSDAEFKQFLADHPTADQNADGTLQPDERDAYLAALATAADTQVLLQYPRADLNNDGRLDFSESVELVSGGMFSLELVDGGPHVFAFKSSDDASADGSLKEKMFEGHAIFVATEDESGNAVEPKVVELKLNGDVATSEEKTEDGKKVLILKATPDVKTNGATGGCLEIKLDASAQQGDVTTNVLTKCPMDNRLAEKWLLDNVAIVPTPIQLSDALTAIRAARLNQFLVIHPEADANKDGLLTNDEQTTFLDGEMARVRAKILEKHPEADADRDGVLTEAEMQNYFKSKIANEMTITTDGAAAGQNNVIFIGPPTEEQVIEIQVKEAEKEGC